MSVKVFFPIEMGFSYTNKIEVYPVNDENFLLHDFATHKVKYFFDMILRVTLNIVKRKDAMVCCGAININLFFII